MTADTNPKTTKTATSATDTERVKTPKTLPDDDIGEGLTDDQRVSREGEATGEGARVTPGPADEERLPD